MYSWAYLELPGAEPGHTWILMRRNDSTGELACYHCHQKDPVPLGQLVRVAGQRWTIEESFQAAKGRPASTSTRSGPGRPGTAGP